MLRRIIAIAAFATMGLTLSLARPALGTITPTNADVEQALLSGQLPKELLPDYRAVFPGNSDDQLQAIFHQTQLRDELTAKFLDQSGFAGLWLDPQTLKMTYFTADGLDTVESEQIANQIGVELNVQSVKNSYASLNRAEEQIENALPVPSGYNISVDIPDNIVSLVLPSALKDIPPVWQGLPVRVSFSDDISQPTPLSCPGRINCDIPLRGGINIGEMIGGTALAGCTLGYTLHATDGTRWVYTAGHCVQQSEVDNRQVFGNSNHSIGYARLRQVYGSVDAGWIRDNNAYWLNSTFAWIYSLPDSPVAVNGAVTSGLQIAPGDVTCFSGIHTAPSDDNCGVITGADSSGMPQVSHLHACHGDSGSPVYGFVNGARWAYGLLASGDTVGSDQCTPQDGTIYFSPLPSINDWIDSQTQATVRVDIR